MIFLKKVNTQILDLLSEESQSAFFWLRLDRKILYLNDLAAWIYGWNKDQVIGKNFSLLCQSQKIEDISLKYLPEKDFNSPITEIIHEFKLKNNPLTIIEWNFFPIKEDNRETVNILMIGKDIRKNLKNKNSYLYNIINNVPHTIFWKNRDSVFLGCNEMFAKLAKLASPEDIVGLTDYDLPWKKSESTAYRADDQAVMNADQPKLNIEESQTLADGKTLVLLTSKVPLHDKQGRVNGVLGVYTDITAQKEMEKNLILAKEKAEVASKAKTEFLYNVRHDIRTPFSGLLGLSTLLEGNEKDPQKKEYLHDIAQSAQELLNYFTEIVEYMELEDSTIPILYKPFNIRKVFNEIITMLQPAIKHQLIKLESRIDEKVPDEIIGDRYRVHRILLNLAGNAVKFTKEGQVTIGVDLVKKEDHKMILKIWVKDTGIGIPEDKYNVIFERFSRLTSSYSGIYKGTGLGLWAVKRIVEELGGQIFVESELDKGSLFSCLIPFESLLTE